MKWLFVYAHPDDETVASGAMIALLKQAGEEVKVVCVTNGAAGQVSEEAQQALRDAGSVVQLRRYEMDQAMVALGGVEWEMWEYEDGEITNKMVWGELQTRIERTLREYQPEMVLTFDHTGWYYHLDHVGVSIATTRAWKAIVDEGIEMGFGMVSLRPEGMQEKWQYAYEPLMYTHRVRVEPVKSQKLEALACHASQNLFVLMAQTIDARLSYEWVRWWKVPEKLQVTIDGLRLFESVSRD